MDTGDKRRIGAPTGSVVFLGVATERLPALTAEFAEAGWRVTVASHAHLLETSFAHCNFDVIVVSDEVLAAPILDTLAHLRAAFESLIIVLLTERYNSTQTVLALRIGADDVQHVALRPDELLTRAEVLVRYRHVSDRNSDVIAFGDVTVDPIEREVRRDGVEMAITSRAFTCLLALVRRPKTVMTFRDLHIAMHHQPGRFGARMLSVAVPIREARHAVETNPSKPRWIKTRRGVGYYFDPGGAAASR